MLFGMIILFIVISQQKAARGVAFGHEASYIALIGFLISLCAWMSNNNMIQENIIFDDNVLFYFCIPPIVFASGYNMRRKRFFQNFTNIMIFGVLGTLVTYILFACFTIWIHSYDWMTMYNATTGEWQPLVLSTPEILLMSSLLCSTDVIAAISMVKYEEQPTLFSLLFGEGIVNDAVAIILFNTVLKFFFGETEVEITWTAPFEIFGDFCILGAGSIAIGLVYGLIASIMFKKMRSLTLSSAVECLIIFCIAYMAYVTAELAAMSGIIALLTSGVVMAHYAWYSLSSQGQHGSYLVFQTLGLLMQAFIFSYLGVSFFSFASLDWSPALILVMFGIVIIGRMGGTVGLIGLLRLCGYDSGIAWKEVFFIGYAGLIRGAIAFGLVLRIDGGDVQHRSVIVTTCLTLVVFTTVFFGATVGSMQAFLFPKEHLQEDVDSHASEHSAALHPNEEKEEADGDQGSTRTSRKLGCCLRTWVKLDEWILRDLLIYNYKPEVRKN